jgi:hypothetical protein
MVKFDWRTPMHPWRSEDAGYVRGLRGQAAATILDGERVQLYIMPDRDCFAADMIMSRDDARGLRDMLNRVVDGPLYPKGTPEYAAYEAELKTELAKFQAGEPPYDRR